MQVSVAHTPDADDAFMFYGIASSNVKSGLEIRHVIADIETLNRRALGHELDVTAISAHAYAHLADYAILKSGGSFGINYGPIVLSMNEMGRDKLSRARIAIPGKLTSANLLLMLAIGGFEAVEMPFDSIPEAVGSGKVDAGLVIHEAQITFDRSRFINVFDLGKWWSETTGGLPVPLGMHGFPLGSLLRGEPRGSPLRSYAFASCGMQEGCAVIGERYCLEYLIPAGTEDHQIKRSWFGHMREPSLEPVPRFYDRFSDPFPPLASQHLGPPQEEAQYARVARDWLRDINNARILLQSTALIDSLIEFR